MFGFSSIDVLYRFMCVIECYSVFNLMCVRLNYMYSLRVLHIEVYPF